MNEFEELLSHYPKVTPNGRKLHGNKSLCREKYNKILESKPLLHEFILRCIEEEHLQRMQYLNQNFWKMLQTYLNQRGWELYEDDVNKRIEKEIVKSLPGEKFA